VIEALRAERTKLWTLPSVRWLLVATVASLVALGAAITAMLDTSRCRGGAEVDCSLDPVKANLSGVWVAQIVVVVLGVLAMSTEYDTPQIRLTLAAMPRRLVVFLAKTSLVAVVVGVCAAVGAIGSLTAGRLVLAGNGFATDTGAAPPALGEALTVRAALGTVCYLALVAGLALGSAALVRDAAVATLSVLTLLFLFPLLGLIVTDPTWQERLHRYAPMEAGLAIQATRGTDDLPIGPWAGLGVLAGYSAAALVAGAAAFLLRDA
jgi:ABC-2 type transport system permease protein